MKCFQHTSEDAVGICRACGKALCNQCAIDLDFALTCKGPCETRAASYHKLNENATNTYAMQKKSVYFFPAFFISLGLLLALPEVINAFATGHHVRWFPVISGGVFILFGIAMLFIHKNWLNKLKT